MSHIQLTLQEKSIISKNKSCPGTPKVLIIGPGRTVRGGITSVLFIYEKSDIWTKYHCEWLETYDDVSNWHKIKAFTRAIFLIPKMMFGKDIVHIHAAQNTSFYRKTVFFLLAKLLRKKVIVHLHAPNSKNFSKFYDYIPEYDFS